MQAESLVKILEAVESQMLESTIQDNLSINEIISLYMIDRLHHPSIVEFAKHRRITQSNATYLVRKLIDKGYLEKRQHSDDKREFLLYTTDKFSGSIDYASSMIERLAEDVLPLIDQGREYDEMDHLLNNLDQAKQKPAM